MAGKKAEKDEGGSRFERIMLTIIGVVFIVFILAYVVPKSTTESVHSGVKVVSEIPLEKLRTMQYIALYNTSTSPGELTCKFELSAISQGDINGYRIRIMQGDQGVYIKEREAQIKGANDDEILEACHEFACLRDGIDCPDFKELGAFFAQPPSMSVILDTSAGRATGRGYAELMGALSYLQIKMADTNHDEYINQSEIDGNEFFIYPFLKEGDMCRAQPFNTLMQNWTGRNETVNCSLIGPAIVLAYSNESSIRVDGNQVMLEGSDDAAHTESIIIRDIIAPDWIRRLYNMR